MQFWFELASTYSYPAAMRVGARAAAANVDLVWRPFLLGPIFQAQGWNDSPFNVYPVKGRYMWRDLERICRRDGVPFQRPSRFPRPSLIGARVACVGSAESWGPDFVRAVYRANFAEDREIGEPEVVAAILSELGVDANAVLTRAQSAEVKAALRANTEEATALGIFGAPSFVADGELFWGTDRLDDALAWAHREP
jgi:2-hydroxychromene-2-carboxylate isomerase